ncbi:NADH-ubiquinone reductase complex 1 MLRQ subunit [Quillaja saponaria]|uniref:NADH-ubiquinone reductase complex 1 MLRQ subunit n=1 Tax=Quillaja saponaria TaxID=32244 RepID=A0AAD7PIS9_QUISA|nr:NADH-ubiquinone reductase complex 1 MLRQ subunit [Quillaja saponaria]
MAFRSTMGYLKTLMGNSGLQGGIGSRATYMTSTPPKMAYSPTADYAYVHQQHQQAGAGKSSRPMKGDFVAVYVAIGMIALSVTLGLHTAKQQLMHSPTVYVKKERRETLPEVVEPEHIAEEAEKFFKKSFFRKIAHVQKAKNPNMQVIPDQISRDAYAYRPKIDTLQSVGVDPKNV